MTKAHPWAPHGAPSQDRHSCRPGSVPSPSGPGISHISASYRFSRIEGFKGTGHQAHFASDAKIRIHQDQSIFRPFGDRFRGADDLARRRTAMHTREREVRQPNHRVGSFLQGNHPLPPDRIVEEGMMSLACHHAGITRGAAS